MTDKDLRRQWRQLEMDVAEGQVRIRRYSIDPRLRETGQQDLRDAADAAWQLWVDARRAFYAEREPTEDALRRLQAQILTVERKTDLIQRELISGRSQRAGSITIAWLAIVLIGLGLIYLSLHNVRWNDFSQFEPFAEWGPLKYVEVAFWGTFGALCALLYFAANYLLRRDFDEWYRGWYVSMLLRAPFLVVILMLLVLEFVEWYGQDGGWIHDFLLDEGNKFYFIAFMSFMLGIMIREASDIIRNLGDGVAAFVDGVVSRISDRLSSALSRPDPSAK
jgi:hypothetical protein